ncbi:MAG: type II and III secretion system protein family protein [Alphaproteobacteria bacterium]
MSTATFWSMCRDLALKGGLAVCLSAAGALALTPAADAASKTKDPKGPPTRPASIYQANTGVEKIDVKVTLHKTETIRVATSFSEALVGNANVADVMPLTDRSIYIVGKKVGVTRLSMLDRDKQLLGIIDVEVTYDLDGLRKRITRASGAKRIKVSSVNGKILLTGTAADAPALQGVMALAEQIAPPKDITNAMKVAAPQQVQLEVRFIEADRSASRALGINGTVTGNRAMGVTGLETVGGHVSTNSSGDLVNGLVRNIAGGLTSNAVPFGTMIGRVLAGGTEADIVIKALEERGLARRLAEPNLVALSGDTASFLAGGEFPFPVGQDNNKISIEFKKFGVGLSFTPTVLSDGQINLKIEPEVSELDATNSLRVNDIVIPSLVVRRASTTIELRDGQSFAVAGLLQSRNVKDTRQLPWISDVPVLGALFRSTSWEKNETDLIIIVTPRLVKPRAPGQKIATPLDKRLPSNDPEQFLLGKHEVKAPRSAPLSGHIVDWKRETPINRGRKGSWK